VKIAELPTISVEKILLSSSSKDVGDTAPEVYLALVLWINDFVILFFLFLIDYLKLDFTPSVV